MLVPEPEHENMTFRQLQAGRQQNRPRTDERGHGIRPGRRYLPQDATDLSFVVANLLHCENIRKQHLLETTDTVDRIAEMLPILEQQIIEAEEADKVESLTNFRLTPQHFDDVITPN